MSSKESVTVLMSVYNDAEYLRTSIKSILGQTHKEFEFIIIDDGSTDNTEETIYAFKDPRIIYKKRPHSGLAASLNFGISIAQGEWIARIDADDLSTNGRLKTQIDFSSLNPDCNVISSWSVYFKEPHKILFFVKTPESDNDITSFLNLHNPINHSSVFFKKKVIAEQGGYNNNFKCYEDFELWFRLKNKLRFKIIPEFLVYTRSRNDSITKTESKAGIYNLLFTNAEKNLINSGSDDLKKYWINILFWIEYFYGDKVRARKYLKKNFNFKKAVAFLNTYLPDKAFDTFAGSRIRYRIQSQFENKKPFENELKNLLSD
ncbi:MAG: glycosyltransferase [Ignavibacteria bacterium]